MKIEVRCHEFILSPQKAMFWIQKKKLLLADVHLSKETHFRKNGIAVPTGITQNNLNRLDTLIKEFNPDEIIVLGDLFHSDENSGVELFRKWRKNYNSLQFALISGNHDVMRTSTYADSHIHIYGDSLLYEDFIFTHNREAKNNFAFNFYGHIHPSVLLHGKAKQSLRLPCFWVSEKFLVLPAFGNFTGTSSIQPGKNDLIYAVAEKEIIRVQ